MLSRYRDRVQLHGHVRVVPRPHPLYERKGVWWLLQDFLYVLTQQSWFRVNQSECTSWICHVISTCSACMQAIVQGRNLEDLGTRLSMIDRGDCTSYLRLCRCFDSVEILTKSVENALGYEQIKSEQLDVDVVLWRIRRVRLFAYWWRKELVLCLFTDGVWSPAWTYSDLLLSFLL